MLRTFIVVTGYIRRQWREWPLFSPVEFKAKDTRELKFLLKFHKVQGEVMEAVDLVESWTNEIDPEIDN